MSRDAPRQNPAYWAARYVWWIHPAKLALYFLVPVYCFIVYVVPVVWPEVIVLKRASYIRGPLAATGLAMLGLVALFAFVGSRVDVDRPRPHGHVIAPSKLALSASLTVLAYIIWFFPIMLHGRLFLERDELNQTPGITSFTQMGIPFALAYLHCRFAGGQAFPRYVRLLFFAIVVLTVARVFIWSERLALIELAVPAAIVLLVRWQPRRSAGRRVRFVIGVAGPYLAVPVLLVAFGFTEYFRSWQTYAYTQRMPLAEFMTSRVVTYYFTALNNGAGMLATRTDEWPTYDFFFTANWLYRLPLGIGDSLYTAFIGHRESPSNSFLNAYADPEFNNMSGIFPIMYDLGTFGAGLYFAAFGLLAGLLYRSMLRGSKWGSMFYPVVFLGCLEIMRTPYLNGARVILLFIGAMYLLFQMRDGHATDLAPFAPTGRGDDAAGMDEWAEVPGPPS
jgi:hypothetical protein